ncbi:hypothetical protein ACFP8W_23285, partial [Nocardioides hankookensis]
MGLRHVAAVTSLLLAGSVLVAGSSEAEQLDGADHLPASVSGTVPEGGSLSTTSPTIGKIKQGEITLQPKPSAEDEEIDAFDKFVASMGTLPKRKRLLVCVVLHTYVSAGFPSDPYEAEYKTKNASAAAAILGACLQLAGLITYDQAVPLRQAGRR